jgi:hypothetical protein
MNAGGLFHPFRVGTQMDVPTQGALAALATLGFVILPLRGKCWIEP